MLMRIIKLLLLFSGLSLQTVAQDTIIISTFDWKSESRDSLFQFPDGNQEYHKILMEYGMRCHDLAVGNGATGCREWDYSCNTIIYDSTRTDSILVDNGQGQLIYETRSPVRYEIMSFVTPYGNGLDLGPEGKTWTFDVTDYAPILRGKKRIALTGGGENQEEMQITFKFITGTPEREVIDILPIWPLEFGVSGGPINDNIKFEPREVNIPMNSEHVKIKSVITGHGQTGEFTPFEHRITVNGDRMEAYRVWKECSDVPVYPQGGTWLLDRAGWCPGDPSQVNTFELTKEEINMGSFEIDYEVKDLIQAPDLRYIVNHQAIFYGEFNFQNDLEILDIIRPSKKVEHARFNPVCFHPKVVIRNTGEQEMQTAQIRFEIVGRSIQEITWNGSLNYGETDTLDLTYDEEQFLGLTGKQVFRVEIITEDDYEANNLMSVDFDLVNTYKGERVLLLLTTNKAPNDNRLELRGSDGELILEYDDLEASRSYFDEIELGTGCYEMLLTDSRDDGLYYWAYEQNGPNIGRGGLEIFVDDESVYEIEPEFGRFVQYAFAIDGATATDEQTFKRLRIYPNPSQDEILVDVEGEIGESTLEIHRLDGVKMANYTLKGRQEVIDISRIPQGVYMLTLNRGTRIYRSTLIKQ